MVTMQARFKSSYLLFMNIFTPAIPHFTRRFDAFYKYDKLVKCIAA